MNSQLLQNCVVPLTFSALTLGQIIKFSKISRVLLIILANFITL